MRRVLVMSFVLRLSFFTAVLTLCHSESYCEKAAFVSHNCSRFDHGTGFLESVGLALRTGIDGISVRPIVRRRKRKRLNCGCKLDLATTSRCRRGSNGRPLYGREPYYHSTDLSLPQSNKSKSYLATAFPDPQS
jgi:hypothetical protein